MYNVGGVLLILGHAPLLLKRDPSTFFVAIAFLSFAVGFASWAGPQLRKVWESSLGKLLLPLLHGLVLLLSIIWARFLVAEALGLPPQDFDMTVGIWTLVLYVPVWVFVIAILTFLFYVMAMVSILILEIVNLILDLALPLYLKTLTCRFRSDNVYQIPRIRFLTMPWEQQDF